MTARTTGLVARHLRWGWGLLLVFLGLGLVLEAMHGLKVGFYLDADNQTRRLMWTLAHAHGALLGLIHLGFAWTVRVCPGWTSASRSQASWWLAGAGVALPCGFLLGGLQTYGGDPGVGIALAALGGLMLFVAVLLTFAGIRVGVDDGATDRPPRGGKPKRR